MDSHNSHNLQRTFEESYDTHADMVYRFCFFKTSDKNLAEDMTQDVFMRYWNYISKGSEVQNTKGLIFQIARNLIVDYYRSKKSLSLESLEDDGYEPASTDHTDMMTHVESNLAIKYIEKLEPKYKDVVYLRLVEELSFDEIAEALNITANAATVRLHRGTKMIKDLLQEEKK